MKLVKQVRSVAMMLELETNLSIKDVRWLFGQQLLDPKSGYGTLKVKQSCAHVIDGTKPTRKTAKKCYKSKRKSSTS